jgi:hypothetical protein
VLEDEPLIQMDVFLRGFFTRSRRKSRLGRRRGKSSHPILQRVRNERIISIITIYAFTITYYYDVPMFSCLYMYVLQLIAKLLLLGLAGQRSVGNSLHETLRDFLREYLLHMGISNESQYIPRQKARFESNSSS